MSRHQRTLKAVAMTAAALAVILPACGEFDEPANPVRLHGLRMFCTEMSASSSNRAETVVGPANGGELVLARHAVTIPPGALEDSTRITISVPNPRFVMADFGPDGLVFKKPVQVSISYRDLDLGNVEERNLTICLYDPKSNRWVDKHGKLDTVEKTVAVWADHFSRYALSDH